MAIESTYQKSNGDDNVELVEDDLALEFLYALKRIKELKRNFKCSRNKFLNEKNDL